MFSCTDPQRVGMDMSLMNLPIFNKSILKSHNIFKYFGIDLMKLITDNDPNPFNNTVYSFVVTTYIIYNHIFK